MKDLVPIKIKIADREYTVRIVAEDEKIFRLASDKLNAAIKLKKEQMRIHDKADLMAMVAFDCIFDQLQTEQNQSAAGRKLDTLQRRIADTLLDGELQK
jgi:cell division protein ZapA